MQAASEKFASLGLPKLNDYDSKRGRGGGGRGGFSSRGGRGGFHGGAASSAAQKPVRQRTLERKLKRQKGTNRMVDRDSGKMIGNAAHLSERREHMKAKMQVASGELEAMPPKKKKAKLSESSIKKGSLLPNALHANPAPLPEFLMNSNFGRVDENGEKPWDLDEEMRFYEQALGVRKLKSKKKKSNNTASSTEGDGDESDDAELDNNALSKLRGELDEDGLGDLFDFCDMLEKDDDDPDRDSADDEYEDEIDNDAAASQKKNSKKSKEDERQKKILEAEARIDRKQDKMEKALKKAMAEAESRSKETQAQLKKINKKKSIGFGGVEITDSENESEDEDEDGEDDEDADMMGMEGMDEEDEDDEEEENEDDEEMMMEDDEEGEDDEEDEDEEAAAIESEKPKSRKRAREEEEEEQEEEDEDEDEAENEDDEAEAKDAEDDEEVEDDAEAAEEDGAEAEADAEGESKSAEEEAPKRKGLTVNEMYGFDAPLPESLLAFRRGEKNILTNATGTSAASSATGSAGAAAAPVLAKYVPPHLRAQMAAAAASGASSSAAATDAAHQTKLAALRRQLKGLLNRMTSANLEHIAIQIQSNLYAEHSKREVTDILCEEMLSLCTAEADGSSAYAVGVNSSTLLSSAALVTFLHASVGADIGAHFLEKFVLAFRELFEAIIARATTSASAAPNAATMKLAATQMRSCSTIVTFLTYLYNFELVSSLLINELIREFLSRTERLTGESIELLLIVLQNCGYQLRKDDPVALKEIILQIQNQSKILMNQTTASTPAADSKEKKNKDKDAAPAAATTSGSHIPEGRVAFMLDMIYDLKNNKKRHSSIYESILPLQNWLSGKLKRKSSTAGGELQLRFGLYDIYNIQQKGRWWLVGSAWKGKRMGEEETAGKGDASKASTGDKSANGKINLPKEEGTDNVDLMSLARAQHMNTDVRKSLFLVIMSAVDYMDCYEKLCKLNLPPSQFRQVIKVLLDCCANEKKFNPYYAYVALQLCRMEGGKEMKFTLTLSYWDYIKDEWSDEALKKGMKQKNLRSPAQKDEFMMTMNRRALNLARFLSLLLRENAHVGGSVGHKGNAAGGVTFNVFKSLNFQDMSTVQLLFLTSCLKEFLLNSELPQINQTMLRLHSQIYEKKKTSTSSNTGKKGADESGANKQEEMTLLRDGMDYFLQHHLLPTAQTMARNKENAKMKEQGVSLKQRIHASRKALAGQADEDWMFKK